MIDRYRMKHLSFLRRAVLAALLLLAVTASYAQADKAVPKEYEDFGRAFTSSLIAGDQDALQAALNPEAILNRIFQGITEDKAAAADIRKGLTQSLGQLPGLLVRQFKDRAVLKFVRARRAKDAYYALVRVDFGEQGLSYLDFLMEKDPSGAIKIVDWYDFVQGQFYSDSVRQIIAMAMPKERTLLEKLLGMDKLEKKEIDLYVEQLKLLKNRDYAGWLKKYDDLPPRMQHSRVLLVTRAMATNVTGDQEAYARALKDLYKYFGDDPTLGLLLLDHFYLEGDYKAAKKSLKELTKYTGGDAAIDNLMARVAQAEKNYDESIKYARRAIKSDPEYVDAYFTLMDSSAYAGKYADSVSTMEKLEKDFAFDFDPELLKGLEGYEGFAASDEFKAWKERKAKSQTD